MGERRTAKALGDPGVRGIGGFVVAAHLVAAILAAGPAGARSPPPPTAALPPAPAQQALDAEEALALASSGPLGLAGAFRQAAAPEGVMFLPDPTPALPQLAAARWPGELMRRVQFLAAAPAGDLAFAAGPSLLRGTGRPVGGFYFTVWKRQPDGAWKFVIDNAVEMPPSIWRGLPPPLTVLKAEPPPGPPSDEGLREADGALNVALPKGAAAAFEARLDDQAVVVRAGRPAAAGRGRALALVSDSDAILDAFTLGASRSADGGFGYTYGRGRWSGAAGPQSGYYVRLWRATPKGWRLLADQLGPPRPLPGVDGRRTGPGASGG
jgi:hypothetical protein